MDRSDDKKLAVDFDIFANLEAYEDDNASDTTVTYPSDEQEVKPVRCVRFEDYVHRSQQTSMYFRPTSTHRNPVRRREADFDDFVDWYDMYYSSRMNETSAESTPTVSAEPSPERKVRGRGRSRRLRSRSPYNSSPPILTSSSSIFIPALSRETTGEFPDLTYTSPLRFTTSLTDPETSPLRPLTFT